MELVYAALLLHSADKDVNEENVESVLEGAGIDVESSQVKALVAALEDVDLEEAMSQPAAGAAPAPSGGAEAEATEEADDASEEEAEEEEAPDQDDEEAEEEAAEGLGSLF